MNHYPRHVGDWMTATAHLTAVEECMYSRMVDQYYAREAPLPADVGIVCRLVRAASTVERKAVQVVLAEFFTNEPDGWHQKRCDVEIARYTDRSKKASGSAQQRWCKRNANAYANASETHSVGNANQNQNQNHIHSGAAERAPTSEASAPPPLSLPRNFSLPEVWRDEALRLRPGWSGEEALRVFLGFRDHYASTGERRADWFPAWLKWVRNERGPPAAINGKRAPTLAEKRAANMDVICGRNGNGRDIEGAACRVDAATVLALSGDLRQPGDDDVGGGEPVRAASGLGRVAG